ncbi:hypothetical protein LTR24_010202 [Lithohypha guttulata]|uniref:Fungal lipase-type domain-containing protein n=1 Tax=Lithohypha guttulata TaxID=1690604 RepID=A0ABR0JUP9_9EURO|nr:hypothetical protein LTR24_010202 [Lithohypha guttulata]
MTGAALRGKFAADEEEKVDPRRVAALPLLNLQLSNGSMGLFTRKQKPAAYTPQTPPTTVTYASPPPPYLQQAPVVSPPPAQYASQQFAAHGEQVMSAGDYNAVQRAINQDAVIDQFSDIISNIDEDRWNENDEDLSIVLSEGPDYTPNTFQETTRAIAPGSSRAPRQTNQPRTQKITIWSKVSSYSNATLPIDLPPLRVYIPTWPMICLAAQYSASAYRSPQSSHERAAFVSADARLGTKAMVMKSVPCDDKKTLVFAIRGTSTLSLRDWNVNLHTAPVSPAGFLDDEGNLCHAGFLRVAKAMIKPIAMRLRTLLEENPSRSSCSLLITGHSAGGAVAALLFSHMLSSTKSELSILTDCFKRVHCVTFGAPPVSLLPLSKPTTRRFHKSLFFSFMNEGDPVVRAEKAYIRSLVDLLSSPLPVVLDKRKAVTARKPFSRFQQSMSNLDLTLCKMDILNTQSITPDDPPRSKQSRRNASQPNISFAPPPQSSRASFPPTWPVPTATLSNAGRLVIMRVPRQPSQSTRQCSRLQSATSNRWEKDNLSRVTAHTGTDEQLRQVVFGDPSMHAMEVYLRRVDMLALKAVTARG